MLYLGDLEWHAGKWRAAGSAIEKIEAPAWRGPESSEQAPPAPEPTPGDAAEAGTIGLIGQRTATPMWEAQACSCGSPGR